MTALKCAEEVLAVAEGNNQFMLEMHPKLYQRNRTVASNNIFYSAVSMSSMLTMMWESFSDKKCAASQKMLRFLKLNPEKEQLFTAGYAEVLKNYERTTLGPSETSLHILNKMYICDSLGALKEDFLKKVRDEYRCTPTTLSFNNTNIAIKKINSDFAQDSNDLIKEVVSKTRAELASGSKIVLVSSFVFRGIWEVPFKVDETKEGKFTRSNGQQVTVQMMHKDKAPGMSYTNFRRIGCHACALYFEGFRYCMIVVRPSRIGSLPNAINYQTEEWKECLTPDKLIAHFKRYHRKSRRGDGGLLVTIALPRFRITTEQVLNRTLNDSVDSLFVTGTFSAPFNDAFANLPANANPSVTQVIQKCVIEIDERGSDQDENISPTLPARPSWKSRPKYVNMILDHTFYFVLFDYTNNFLIAAGVVDNPTSPD